MGIPAPIGVSASGLPPAGDQANAVVTGQFTAIGPGKPFAFRGPMNVAIWASIKDTLTTTAASGNASVATGTGIAAGQAINSVNVPPGTTWLTFASPNGTLAFPTYTLYGQTNTNEGKISGLMVTAGLLGAAVSGPGIPSGAVVSAILQAAVTPTAGNRGVPGVVQISKIPTQNTIPGTPAPFEFALTNNSVTTGVDANATFTGVGATYVGIVQLERSFDGGSTWILCNVGGAGAVAQYGAGTPVSFAFGEPERNVLYRLNCTAWTSGTINYRISQTGGGAESLAIGQLI